MSSNKLYPKIKEMLAEHIDPAVDENTLERLALLVMGIIESKSAAPAQVAKALNSLGLSEAQVESIERRVRRIENDPEIRAGYCFHPLARQRLMLGKPQQLLLIIDPTTQDERLVMLTISVWYRGRALPLVWAVWPGNQPLLGDGFWERVSQLLEVVKELLPLRIPVIWLADRAFGSRLSSICSMSRIGITWFGFKNRPVAVLVKVLSVKLKSWCQLWSVAANCAVLFSKNGAGVRPVSSLIGGVVIRTRCAWSAACPPAGPLSACIDAAIRLKPLSETINPTVGSGNGVK